MGHVHNATPLAASRRRPTLKSDYLVVVGRITPVKGQHIAATAALRAGVDLILAGPVGPYHDSAALRRGLTHDPSAKQNLDVRYWREQVEPLVDGHRVRWIGTVDSKRRDQLIAHARGTLLPVRWEEPGGLAATESLALGTPIVGYRRGCLPELVDEGSTALLVDDGDEEGLVESIHRVHRLKPTACVDAAVRRFSPAVMADHYENLYHRVLASGGDCRARGKAAEVNG